MAGGAAAGVSADPPPSDATMELMGTPICTRRNTSSAAPLVCTSFSSPSRLAPPSDDGSMDEVPAMPDSLRPSNPAACGSMRGLAARGLAISAPPTAWLVPPMCPSPAPRPWRPPWRPVSRPPPARVLVAATLPSMPSASALLCTWHNFSIIDAYSARTSLRDTATSSSMPPAPTLAGLR